ncbi:capsule biosynthesis protein [Ancylobacter amanitiformis]|uniref:Capsular polysaccharide export protein n=1 Tax=Ancylobacter amanitiformis TaxID=217069 RepID=A0ABU0LV22_9HYPH|nr:capsular biosynthesis protein [Ancylobacter amanitiformis]MDQ0512522.1 capsular polysaccharide export protein [Ancylobacter amanitiformis]
MSRAAVNRVERPDAAFERMGLQGAGLRVDAASDTPAVAAPGLAGRCFLFLQGPASPFAYRLAQALRRRGARIVKVHLCGGDLVFWPGRARLYRGRLEDWPAYVARLMAEQGVSDLVLFGDCRPYHVPAVSAARVRGIGLHLLEEGYFRPGWITRERHGVNAHSDLPRTPERLRAAAGETPEPVRPRGAVSEPFARRAAWDVAWHAGHAALAPFFARYQRHTLVHPMVDYAGWLVRWFNAAAARERDRLAQAALVGRATYFLLPLQLEGDFQMRVHSSFGSVEEVAQRVLASFAATAPKAARLVVKRHPYDTRLPATRHMIARLIDAHGLKGRVLFLENGDIDTLVARSAGVVLVNSTTAIAALRHGRPLKVLGRATYDMPGLAHQGALDAFWTAPPPPDPALVRAYCRVVLARTQIAGGFFAPESIAQAVEGLVARMATEDRVAEDRAAQDEAADDRMAGDRMTGEAQPA